MTQFSKIEKNDAESTHSLVVKLYYGKQVSNILRRRIEMSESEKEYYFR